MKMKSYLKGLVSLWTVLFMVFTVNAQEFCQYNAGQQVGTVGGYDHELWKETNNGGACMELKADAAFSCSWGGGIKNTLARRGKKYNETQRHQDIGTFSASFNCNYNPSSNGASYLGIYGWTYDANLSEPLVEYYIIENTGPNYIPPSDGDPGEEVSWKGTVSDNGSVYDIYTKKRINKPSIKKNPDTFIQYWSVRRNQRSSGTVNITKHFNAWESLNMQLGNMYDVNLVVEGYQSSGWADFSSASLTVSGSSGGGGGNNGTLSGVYRLRNLWANKYLNGGGTSAWQPVLNAPFNNSWGSQKWEVEHVNGNIYRLKSQWGGYYLNGNGSSPGQDVNTGPYNANWTSQQWALEKISGNRYRIKCVWGNYYLNGSNTNWTVVNTVPLNNNWTSQQWVLEQTTSNRKVEEVATTISIFPNPVSDVINVVGLTDEDSHVRIMDINGRTLRTIILSANNSTINVADLSAGLYIFSVERKDSVESLKFVKK